MQHTFRMAPRFAALLAAAALAVGALVGPTQAPTVGAESATPPVTRQAGGARAATVQRTVDAVRAHLGGVTTKAGPIATPSNLQVPGGNVRLLTTYAVGVQVYVCTSPDDNPGAFAWTLKAPEAELRNDAGETIGIHFAGPSWQGNDGSKVVGEAIARADATDPGAIPWLLLKAKSNDGAGVFSAITYVQRLETVGGVAPTDGCDRSTTDATRSVPYTATYVFYYGAA